MKKIKLENIAKLIMGQSPPGDTYNTLGNGLPFFQGKTEFGRISPTAMKWCTQPKKIAQPGDILISVRAPVGPTNLADQECCIGRGLAAIRAKSVDRDFLWLFLQYSEKTLSEKGQGSTFEAINADELKSLEIPDYPLEKQRQIAAHLKAQLAEVDKARQAAEAQLRDATPLKTKALESVFGSVSNKQPIGSVAKLQSGYAFKSESFRTNGIRLLRNANILPGKVYWDEAVFLNGDDAEKHPSYILNDGDVLISLDRPIISSGIKVARVGADDLPALLVQRVGRFILDPQKLDGDYLYAYLQTEMFITEITGHDQSLGVPHISPIQVENIEIPLPSVTVQRGLSIKLTQVLYEWKAATTAIRAMLNDIKHLPKKILGQAFEDVGAGHARETI